MDKIETHRLAADALSVGYEGKSVLSGVNLTIPDGKITALIGSNGSGKSTLLRTLGRVADPISGSVILDGRSIASNSRRMTAKIMALLPQNPVSPDGLTVRELCRFGRHPHRSILSFSQTNDDDIVDRALAATHLTEFSERPLHLLSGGQRQRAWIAMALVQETPILLLDEPTTYLDIAHQIDILNLLSELNRNENRTIVMVVHDLNQAAQFAHQIIAVSNGGIYAVGSPEELLTETLIKDVFGIEAVVIRHPVDGTPLCLPLRVERAHITTPA
ncbi:ABC transporter ATP-binding protein [Phyllobacterium sp. SB3]|uniref:ABC transporter ATP-binding protein n=1 Tax=Phyllobacterium sp. SB3 TaxID=3156073 RepID=UPI0032AF7FDF